MLELPTCMATGFQPDFSWIAPVFDWLATPSRPGRSLLWPVFLWLPFQRTVHLGMVVVLVRMPAIFTSTPGHWGMEVK